MKSVNAKVHMNTIYAKDTYKISLTLKTSPSRIVFFLPIFARFSPMIGPVKSMAIDVDLFSIYY